MKNKESKQALAKKASSKALEIPWREESLAIPFPQSDVRTCDVILMVESEEQCSEVIFSCYMGYKLNQMAPVKILTYTDLKLEVIECMQSEKAADKNKLFANACEEAVLQLERGDTISAELLSHLIKFKVIETIEEDIKMEQEQIFIQTAKDNEYKKLFEVSSDAGADKKKKGKEKPAKEAKKQDAGKKGKKSATPSEETCRIGTNPPKPYSHFSKPSEHPEIQVESKHLYVVLTGFYNPDLLLELVKVGVPLCCLLEVSFTQSALFRAEFSESTASDSNRSRVHSQDDVISTIEGESVSEENLAVPPTTEISLQNQLENMQTPFRFFWTQVIELMHAEQQHSYMENVFHMFYKLSELSPPELISSEFDGLCNDIYEKQFRDLSNYLFQIETLKRQYINYMRNLRLQAIPCAPTVLPPQCLRTYNKLMNKFPPDCFSIALLMACLLEEVCTRVPESVADKALLENVSEDNPLESDDIESKPPTETHGGIRDQIVNVFESYKRRYDPLQGNKDNNNQRFRCYTCKYDPKIDLKIDSKCFTVHASNELQVIMNCYKRLSKELFEINMNGLKKCKAAIFRSRHAVSLVLEKLMNEYNLQSWRKALNLTKDELCDAIHTFLLTQLKDNIEPQSSETELPGVQRYPYVMDDMLFQRFKIDVESVQNDFDAAHHGLSGQLSFGMLYRNFSKNVSQILYPGSLSEYCYKEFLPGPVLLQELLKCGLEYECVEQLYSPLTDTLLLLFHNGLNEFGCGTVFKKEILRTPVCMRDFCEYVLPMDRVWIEDQEFSYQTEYRKEVERLKKKKEELRKALYSEFIPEEYYFILPDSIKAKLMAKDEPPAAKDSGKKKGGKAEKKSSSESSKKDKGKKDNASQKKAEAPLDIEEVIRKMPEVPEKKTLTPRCAQANEPYTFIAYDLGNTQVQINGWTSVFHSLDGLKAIIERTCWLGSPARISVKLVSNSHSFFFHYRPDLVTTEPFLFHSILSDGSCLVFSKPTKFQKPEDIICERICKSKHNKTQTSEENTAYQKKPQEIYFVSEKQDCVVKSLKVPFSTEKNLVLSENLLVPFLDSLEKFNIRAHVSLPPETLRERQQRRHNLKNRISTAASVTKTSLSHYASARKNKKTSITREGMAEKYSPKVIVHRPGQASTMPTEEDDFLQHSSDVKTIKEVPSTLEIKKRKEALEKLKEAALKHLPMFKICSSRLHKFTYVKRIKSYINIPVGSVMKRVLYKPAYCKTKRTIEIKKCLPLGCVNVSKMRKPAYNLRISLPSGLIIRDIPGVASEYPCIKQYYIDKGPQCKDIVHEESRTFLRNGNIAIKRCDGNINVLSANGRIFHFEVPYVMKTRTERLDYRDANVPKKRAKPNPVPVHVAKRSLTTFQNLLHRVLPRRFKHMIDSKESRYYLSRRAYLKAQKKYCTNVNMLYLLESQRQPFPEYTVITPDGKKIKVSQSKVYEKHKFYVATEFDFRSEETLFEREDGTCCILNREGVLTTQFPDGTRLTTWYVESPNQVFADEIEDLHTKNEIIQTDNPLYLQESRILPGAFDFVMDEGWVSIFMYYEYSHPNYATVVFGGEDSEMSVVLPNGCRITSNEGQQTTVTVGKFLKSKFDKSKFHLTARGCENCANSANAVVDIASWYRGKLPKNKGDNFVLVKDSFEKYFTVDYDGKCSRNPTETTKAETNCMRHVVPTLEKLFSIKSDLSGCVFWNKTDFKTLVALAEKNEHFTVDAYSSGNEENAVIEFKEYICKPYHERYICKYDEPVLKLTKYKTRQGKVAANPAYILRNVLRKVVSISKLEPLYKCILENCEKYGLRKKYENFELFFTHVTQQVPAIQEGLTKEDTECADPCPCNLTKKEKVKMREQEAEEMNRIQSLHDKWYKWQEECKKYKQLVKENYVPLYFKSKFGSEFSDENRKDSEEYVSRPSKPRKESVDRYEENDEERTEMGKMSSFGILPAKGEDIDVEIRKSVDQKPGKRGTRVVREELRIKIPKNMVLLYNQRRDDKDLHIGENEITSRSESHGQSESHPEKMLILAGVTDASKVAIANKFLDMHGTARQYEDGSKVVIVAGKQEDTKVTTVNGEGKETQEDNPKKEDLGSKASLLLYLQEQGKPVDPNLFAGQLEKQAIEKPQVSVPNLKGKEGKDSEPSYDVANETNATVPVADHEQQSPQAADIIEEELITSLSDEIARANETTKELAIDPEVPPLIDDDAKADIAAYKSATDVLKDVVVMSKELLDVVTDERTPSVDDPDDPYPCCTKRKVMSVLSSLLKMVIGALSECPEDIPPNISKSITQAAHQLILSSSLNKSEMKLFLKALDDVVEEAFAQDEAQASVESSDVQLVDKSKLIPVRNIGDVLSNYSRAKQAKRLGTLRKIERRSSGTAFNVNSAVNNQPSGRTDGDLVESEADSDITVSFHDLEISDSLIGFTSKFNFRRYSDTKSEEKLKESSQYEPKQSSAEIVYSRRRKSSASASHVKFEKGSKASSQGSLQVIHQSDLLPLSSETERVGDAF